MGSGRIPYPGIQYFEAIMHTKAKMLPAPNLDQDQILRVVCGLRPCRHGGLRIEAETIDSIGKTIVHNYGHGGSGITLGFGTALEASDLVDQYAEPGSAIGVLGSGVIGLTNARELLKRGYRVTVYADKAPAETTSLIAGALWLPLGVDFGETPMQIEQFQRVLHASYEIFQNIDRERFGVEQMPIYEPAYAAVDDRFFCNGTICHGEHLDHLPLAGPPRSGRVFRTDFIHTDLFLDALVAEVTALGGRFETRHFDSIEDLAELEESVLVNAMALGSKAIFGDEKLYPARGVLVHLKPQDLGYGVHDGFKYMFPRKSCLILGGCFMEDDWNDQPDEAIVREILGHHRRFFGQG